MYGDHLSGSGAGDREGVEVESGRVSRMGCLLPGRSILGAGRFGVC